jgi:hypothetical protein
MNTHAEDVTIDGVTMQIGTITHEGKAFVAIGSSLDPIHGHAYVHADNGRLTNWIGHELGTYRVVSQWDRYGSAIGPYCMQAIRARIAGDDRTWYGRFSPDWGSLVHLRPCK